MTNIQHVVLISIGVLCIPVSLLILRVLFSTLFHPNKRWHRTGLWFFALGYAVLALSILGDFLGLENSLWIYILADAAFVMAPCIILASYALDRSIRNRSINAE